MCPFDSALPEIQAMMDRGRGKKNNYAWRDEFAALQTCCREESDETPLLRAVEQDQCEIATLYLSDRVLIDTRDRFGNTPLLQAAAYGHHKMAKLLMSVYVEVNAVDANGRTSLMRAASRGG